MHALVRPLTLVLLTSSLALAGCGSDDGNAPSQEVAQPVAAEGVTTEGTAQQKRREEDVGDDASCKGAVGKRSAECLEQIR